MIRIFGILVTLLSATCNLKPAQAHDSGQYAQASPELRDWFRSLHSGNGIPCCDTSDGRRVDDADWDIVGGEHPHYKVRIDGEWYDVPPEAVIDQPNRLGGAIVWPVPLYDGKSSLFIRCFMPGAGT